ncbi:MAG: DUF5320 domain-containing protein [Candidatus Neomarinimicrobiota bacterium]|jgi:hypothetical protein
MPGLDGKGPMGQGSKTGRGLGNCNPVNDTPNNENNEQTPVGGGFFGRGMGRGLGMNRGFGRGLGRGFGGRGFRRNRTGFNNNDNTKG